MWPNAERAIEIAVRVRESLETRLQGVGRYRTSDPSLCTPRRGSQYEQR